MKSLWAILVFTCLIVYPGVVSAQDIPIIASQTAYAKMVAPTVKVTLDGKSRGSGILIYKR